MNFEWDAAKNRSNIRKHGSDLADAAETFQGALLVGPDTREEYGESRWIGIGMIRHQIAVVAFAERAEETVRIISVRKANHKANHVERKQYEKALQDELETR